MAEYNKEAVERAIRNVRKGKRIKKAEALVIHRLLKGRER